MILWDTVSDGWLMFTCAVRREAEHLVLCDPDNER
jgi:hypothetical protein